MMLEERAAHVTTRFRSVVTWVASVLRRLPRGKFARSEAPNWMKLDVVFPGADSFRHHHIG